MNRNQSLLTTLALGAALAVAGCASSGQGASSGGTGAGSSPASSPSTSAPPSCHDQVIAWRDSGGSSDVKTISNDLGKAIEAAATGNLGAVQGAATTLGSDSQTASGDLPPGCVPGMRTDYQTALQDFMAASDSSNKGDISGIVDASSQVTAGGKAIERATKDLTTWEQDGQP
jgi:hypothetical protein